MSLDLTALRAKLNSFKGINDRQAAIWKPTEGKTTIRIVPWKENSSNPFAELYFHYMGPKTYLSPISYGDRDPIAEFADKLRSENTKEAFAQSRQFMPKLRTYVPVIVRGEEEKGVRFWSFGKTVYEELLSIIDDPDYGDIVDPNTGRDIVVEYIPKEKSDTNFAKTNIRAKPSTSPASPDAKTIELWLKNQPDLKEIYKAPSYAELEDVLAKYIDQDVVPAGVEVKVTDVVPSATVETKSAAEPNTSQEVIKAFDELFSK
jgi:hypothetical protein